MNTTSSTSNSTTQTASQLNNTTLHAAPTHSTAGQHHNQRRDDVTPASYKYCVGDGDQWRIDAEVQNYMCAATVTSRHNKSVLWGEYNEGKQGELDLRSTSRCIL